MATRFRLRTLLQLCALLGGTAALFPQSSTTTAEAACRWCTGPYTCTEIDKNGWDGCKVEGGHFCEHTGDKCTHIEG